MFDLLARRRMNVWFPQLVLIAFHRCGNVFAFWRRWWWKNSLCAAVGAFELLADLVRSTVKARAAEMAFDADLLWHVGQRLLRGLGIRHGEISAALSTLATFARQ